MSHHFSGRIGVSVRGMALVCVLAAAAVSRADEGTQPAGGLTCLEPVCHFGTLGPEQTVKHTFVLTNASDRAVVVSAVRAGCGCLTATLATNTVAAGGTVELASAMSLAGRKGGQRKTIYVESGAPGGPLRLEFEGTVLPPIDVMPEGVHFGTLAETGEAEREVMIASTGTGTFQIRSVVSSSSQYSAEAQTVEAGKRYRLRIKSIGPRNRGTCTASIRVDTDHPAMPVLMVPVTVFVAGEVVAAPSSLMLIESAVTNVARTYYIHVYSPGKKAFKVDSVKAPGEGVESRVMPVAPDRYRIEVKFPAAVRAFNGTSLCIKTDMESAGEIQVPLRVVAQPAP